jgi:hypothetical protein
MWNPFKKNTAGEGDKQKMGMLQRIAMKKLERMSPEERNKIMQEALKPENKEKMLAAMDQMKKAGQINEEQYRMAKEKMGL